MNLDVINDGFWKLFPLLSCKHSPTSSMSIIIMFGFPVLPVTVNAQSTQAKIQIFRVCAILRFKTPTSRSTTQSANLCHVSVVWLILSELTIMQVSGKFHRKWRSVWPSSERRWAAKIQSWLFGGVSFDPLEFIFTLELPAISSHGFSRRGAKISLHSAHFFGCCRGKG